MRALGCRTFLEIIGNYIACVHITNVKKKIKCLKTEEVVIIAIIKLTRPLRGATFTMQ